MTPRNIIPRNPLINARIVRIESEREMAARPWRAGFLWVLRGQCLEWAPPRTGQTDFAADGLQFDDAPGLPVTALGFFRRAGYKAWQRGSTPRRFEVYRGECLAFVLTFLER